LSVIISPNLFKPAAKFALLELSPIDLRASSISGTLNLPPGSLTFAIAYAKSIIAVLAA
jgi:hypothetical protein